MKKLVLMPAAVATAVLLTACGGNSEAAESAGSGDRSAEATQTAAPELTPGTVVTSFAYDGFPTTDVDFRAAVVALEDDEADVYNLLTADGGFTTLQSSNFVDIDDVLDVSDDLVLVVGETLSGVQGMHGYSWKDDAVRWSVPAEVGEGDVQLTEDYAVVDDDCRPRAYSLVDGAAVNPTWPAPPAGVTSCSMSTGFRNLVTMIDDDDTYASTVDLAAGTEVGRELMRPNFDESQGRSGYGFIRDGALAFDDGETSWRAAESMPSDAEVTDVRHGRVIVRMDDDGFLWTVYDAETGKQLSLVNLQSLAAADDCDSGGLMRTDRLLLGCESDDDVTLYVIAV